MQTGDSIPRTDHECEPASIGSLYEHSSPCTCESAVCECSALARDVCTCLDKLQPPVREHTRSKKRLKPYIRWFAA